MRPVCFANPRHRYRAWGLYGNTAARLERQRSHRHRRHLDCASTRRLSYTACRIHLITTYRALQSVTLRSHKGIATFVKYMLGDMSHRVSALRKLALLCNIPVPLSAGMRTLGRRCRNTGGEEELYSDTVVRLTDLLRGAISLRVLVILSAEVWMAYDPRICCVHFQICRRSTSSALGCTL